MNFLDVCLKSHDKPDLSSPNGHSSVSCFRILSATCSILQPSSALQQGKGILSSSKRSAKKSLKSKWVKIKLCVLSCSAHKTSMRIVPVRPGKSKPYLQNVLAAIRLNGSIVLDSRTWKGKTSKGKGSGCGSVGRVVASEPEVRGLNPDTGKFL